MLLQALTNMDVDLVIGAGREAQEIEHLQETLQGLTHICRQAAKAAQTSVIVLASHLTVQLEVGKSFLQDLVRRGCQLCVLRGMCRQTLPSFPCILPSSCQRSLDALIVWQLANPVMNIAPGQKLRRQPAYTTQRSAPALLGVTADSRPPVHFQ